MLSNYLRQGLLVLAGSLLLLTFAACGSAAAPQQHNLTLQLADGAMSPDTVPAQQGDTVVLQIESDQAGTIHFHGYGLQRELTPEASAPLQFIAETTGRFPITFHAAAAADGGHSHAPGVAGGAVELWAPVNPELVAEVDPAGGLHVRIITENWQWAPEEVNLPARPGVGHAHIYANGEKLSRVYGPYHYVPDLSPGTYQIKVDLNDNQHNALTVNGAPLETTIEVTIPDTAAAAAAAREPAATEVPISLELTAHPDPLGGYNLQITPEGFEFDQESYGEVSIDGAAAARAYVPWLLLPELDPGEHTIAVALHNGEGQPLEHYGQPVAAAITVGGGAAGSEGMAGMATGDMHSGHSHDHGAAASAAEVEELDLGFLVVTPR